MAFGFILPLPSILLISSTLAGSAINIPLTGKPTNQTGVFRGLTSDKAVDGIKHSKQYGQDYCAHPNNTEGQPAEWWIDLEQMYRILRVILYNTADIGGYWRMQNFTVRVYSPGKQSAVTCAEYPGTAALEADLILICPYNTYGQYVQFLRLGGGEINRVTICEVEIIGELFPRPIINIPLTGKPSNQTGAWDGLTSDKAVDGKMYTKPDGNKYCAHPDNTDDGQPAEWWIDLEQIYLIHSVTLYNTGDGGYWRMQNFAIRVYSAGIQSAVTCAEYAGTVASAASVTLTCPSNTHGQYVQFIRLGGGEIDKVTICEVEVIGQQYPCCPPLYYGVSCQQFCGYCADVDSDVYNSCDQTGKCVNGCQMWWAADDCQTEIVRPSYTDQKILSKEIASDRIVLVFDQVDIPLGMSEFYGYKITYNDKTLTVSYDANKQTITVALVGLKYNTEYTMTIQPYRVMKGQYDFGKSYPQKTFIIFEASNKMPYFLPWLLLGIACVIIIILIPLLIYSYRRQRISYRDRSSSDQAATSGCEQAGNAFRLQDTQTRSRSGLNDVADNIYTTSLDSRAIGQLTGDTKDYEHISAIVSRREDTALRRQYEELQRQTTDDRNGSPLMKTFTN